MTYLVFVKGGKHMKGTRNVLRFSIGGLIIISLIACRKYGVKFEIHELSDFATIFTSIMLESIPFIIIGSIISALIQLYVSQEFIEKILPKSQILGYLGAGLVGILFPICECAIVPIARRLISKGMPAGIGVTFMLAVPIVNPVVIMSTYYAFSDRPSMVLVRTVGGFACAVIIGILIDAATKEDKRILSGSVDFKNICDCGCMTRLDEKKSKIAALAEYTNREFLDILKYLILGAFLSSTFQVIAAHNKFSFGSSNKILSIAFMMFLGFALSLCSEADAFVGKTFSLTYPYSSIISFLLIGPMLDMKNLIMISGSFTKKFTVKLSFITLAVVFLVSSVFAMCGV